MNHYIDVIHLPDTIHSGLKCCSQIKILFASILFLSSGVISRVRKSNRSHSSRAFRFNSFVSSPSDTDTEEILNSESLCFPQVGQPKKAQLPMSSKQFLKMTVHQSRSKIGKYAQILLHKRLIVRFCV